MPEGYARLTVEPTTGRKQDECKEEMAMNKRNFLVAFAASSALALALSATAATAEPVKLTYWSGFTGGDKQAYEDLIKKFNDTHPDIQIDYQLQPWDSIAQKLPTAIASGSGPDLATPDYNVATLQQYVANGLALPLDDLVQQLGPGVLPQTIVDSFSVNGKLYAAPANFATLLLYYNKDLLKGAAIDGPPKTMQELRDEATKLSDGHGQYGIALADNATIPMWPVLIWSDGGDLISKNCSALADPKTVGTVEKWAALVREKKISPVGSTGQDADNLFAAGKAAFEINGPWAAGSYKAAKVNFDVAPVPVGDSGKPVTLASTVPTIVSSKTAHPKEAQVFLAWWLSKETQAQLATSAAYAPSRNDMASDPSIAASPIVAAFTAQVPNARLYLPTAKNFAKIDTGIFIPAIQSATQKGDTTGALKAANDQLNKLLGCP
jgi:multiple sugar transport system substrate-binding protein